MHAEIEAKLKVDSLEAVEQQARRVRRVVPARDGPDGCVLRHGRPGVDPGGQVPCVCGPRRAARERLILAYKGPKEQDDYKKRVEVELEVKRRRRRRSRCLAGLGYHKALAFNKRRRLWQSAGLRSGPRRVAAVGSVRGDRRAGLRHDCPGAGDAGTVRRAAHHGQLRLPDRARVVPAGARSGGKSIL